MTSTSIKDITEPFFSLSFSHLLYRALPRSTMLGRKDQIRQPVAEVCNQGPGCIIGPHAMFG